MTIETLAAIEAPSSGSRSGFYAGVVLWGEGEAARVIEAAPIVRYMKIGHWTRARVREHCRRQGWRVSVVHRLERPEIFSG